MRTEVAPPASKCWAIMAAMPGRVRHIDGPVIAIDGLEEASIHDIVEVEGGGRALVTALWRDRVEAVALDHVSVGGAAHTRGPLAVPAGEALLGRIIDPLGRPLDGGPAIGEQMHRVFFAPPPLPEIGSAKRLTTGLLVYDLQLAITTGSSILATGPGHIARHILRHQAHAGRVAIYVRPTGGAHNLPMARALFETQDSRLARAPRALRPCIAIEPAGGTPRTMGWLAPFSAMAMAAAFRERGQDVVVLLDGLDNWRSTMSEVPWQGHALSQIARLTTQCYTTATGSVTFVALVSSGLVNTGRAGTFLAGVPPDVVNMRSAASVFDRVLDLDDAARGTPAWLTKYVRPPLRAEPNAMWMLGGAMVGAAELREIGGDTWLLNDPATGKGVRASFDQGLRIREALKFRPTLPLDSAEQLVSFIAVCSVKELPAAEVLSFLRRFEDRVRAEHAGLLDSIRSRREITRADLDIVTALARKLARRQGSRPESALRAVLRQAARIIRFLRSPIGRQ